MLCLYYPPICCENDFWGLVNTEMSSGGWPSLMSDNSPNWVGSDLSFYGDDFVEWIPWAAGGIGLDAVTWGAIKALYGSSPLETPGSCDYFTRFTVNNGTCATLLMQ